MKSPARMHRTLVSLAVAMTTTAVGLHWMDPSARAGRSAYGAGEIVSLANAAVGDAVAIRTGQWRDVEITVDDSVGNKPALTASRDRRACHFFVDAAGRPTRERQWSDQVGWGAAPNTVRIHLERATAEGPTAAQWFTARSLILAVDAAVKANGTMLIHSPLFDDGAAIYSSSL